MNYNPKRRSLRAESLESRMCMAASLGWDGPGLGSATLTYSVDASASRLDSADVQSAIETALKAWSDIANIKFIPTNQIGLRDSLDFSFVPIDGSGGTLAQAYLPDDVNPSRIAGDIEFDSSENWEVGNSLGTRATDLVLVAVHEIGHALGLEHDDTVGSTLNATISPNASFTSLPPSDVDSILALYAPADTLLSQGVDETIVNDNVEETTPPSEQQDSTPRLNPWARRSPRNSHPSGHGFKHFQPRTDETSSTDTPADEASSNSELTTRLDHNTLLNHLVRIGRVHKR